MRIQLLEHDPEDFSRTNISFWAADKGYPVRQTYVCSGDSLPALETFDWLMIMGGSQHAWDEENHPWLKAEKTFIKTALNENKCVLGICFGAQLIAEALGEKIFPNPQKEIGWHEVRLNEKGRESFLFNKIPSRFVSFHWHSDHFSLPANCTALASSEATATQAFVCRDMPVAGIQFHPEYTREMVGYYAHKHSQDWKSDRFVQSGEAVLERLADIPDTYWLMDALLNNIQRAFF